MKNYVVAFFFLVILCLVSVSARLVQKIHADKAPMLNRAICSFERYNLVTGSNIQAVFPTFLFLWRTGYDRMMANYPNYSRANSLKQPLLRWQALFLALTARAMPIGFVNQTAEEVLAAFCRHKLWQVRPATMCYFQQQC